MTNNIEKMAANTILKFDSKPNQVYVAQSKVKGADDGLFAKKHITRGSPVVVYHGSKTTDQEIYDMYTDDPDAYDKVKPYIRGTPNGFAINGEKCNNAVLMGIYVNDVACIDCVKEDLTLDIVKEYAATLRKCNLKTVDTLDYPLYYAPRRIKKNEEFYAHYGIGYWLSEIGCSPEEINALNKEYDFESLYK